MLCDDITATLIEAFGVSQKRGRGFLHLLGGVLVNVLSVTRASSV